MIVMDGVNRVTIKEQIMAEVDLSIYDVFVHMLICR